MIYIIASVFNFTIIMAKFYQRYNNYTCIHVHVLFFRKYSVMLPFLRILVAEFIVHMLLACVYNSQSSK